MQVRHPKIPAAALAALLSVVLGCNPDRPGTGVRRPDHPLAGLTLNLAVVDDPPLAAALERLRGEWSVRTGGEFHVRPQTEKEFQAAPRSSDAVIGPSHLLATLVEQKQAAPLDAGRAAIDAPGEADIFELLRLREITWGGQTYAVPFGSPVLVCYYRPDLLAKLGRRPPTTWSEYQELAQLMADRRDLPAGLHAVAEPLGPGWAGLVLLARAAAYAKHRQNYSALFHIDTMEPLVAGPPFRRALEELVAAARLGPKEQLHWGPAEVRQAFWKGRCGLVLSWPTAAGPPLEPAPGVQVGFAELPGSTEVYNIGKQSWDRRADDEDGQVPLLGVGGRIGIVSAGTAHLDAARQLLVWLSAVQPGDPPSAASPAATLFRRSHLQSPRAWVEKPGAAAASQYAALTQETLSRADCLMVPRVPGRAEYLAALDDAVHRAVSGKALASDALQTAALRWKAITDRLGRDRQRSAYLRSLGLEP